MQQQNSTQINIYTREKIQQQQQKTNLHAFLPNSIKYSDFVWRVSF